MAKHAIVTGGLGFIGSHLSIALRDAGWEVLIVDNRSHMSVIGERYGLHDGDLTGCKLAAVDITHTIGFWEHQFKQTDVLFNLAAIARTEACAKDPMRALDVNMAGILNLLQRIRQFNPKVRVVHASSNIVCGQPNVYWASKRAAEDYCTVYRELGLDVRVVRYANVYGFGVQFNDPICWQAMAKSYAVKGYVEVHGDGEQVRDFVHVSDIVAGTIAAAETEWASEIPIDLCTEKETSIRQLAQMFNCEIRHTEPRQGDSRKLTQRYYRAKKMLDWKPRVAFADGFQEIINLIDAAKGVVNA